jgi:hypothetical protein
MITPELQNFISQSRAKGMTDAQIRESLVSSGWNQADLDQAFGIQTTTSGNMGTQKSYKGLIITLVVLFLVLPMLGWMAFAGFTYWGLKSGNMPASFWKNLPDKADYQYSNDDDKNFCSGSKVSLPSSWPSDIPVYPNSKLTTSVNYGGMTGTGEIAGAVGYCTKDSVDAVAKYFVEQNTPWNIKTFLSSNTEGKQNILLAGSKGDLVLSISISGKDGETEFQEMLGSKK